MPVLSGPILLHLKQPNAPDPDHRPRFLADDTLEKGPPAKGCAFQRRCLKRITGLCEEVAPSWREGRGASFARCHVNIEIHPGSVPV